MIERSETTPPMERFWEARYRVAEKENSELKALLRTANIDAKIATQLRRSIENNGKLAVALQAALVFVADSNRWRNDDSLVALIDQITQALNIGASE